MESRPDFRNSARRRLLRFRLVGRNPIGRDLTFDFIRNRWSEMVAL